MSCARPQPEQIFLPIGALDSLGADSPAQVRPRRYQGNNLPVKGEPTAEKPRISLSHGVSGEACRTPTGGASTAALQALAFWLAPGWRNGRRSRLKPDSPPGRGGSNPSPGTCCPAAKTVVRATSGPA